MELAMMTLAAIESWVRGGESDTLELKRTTGERREAARAICAMLNHRGGRVIFGVEPDGRMIGQMVSDRTVEEVAQELGEIEPPMFPIIERIDFTEGRQLLAVTVQAGSGQPYSYRGQAYRRVGNTSRQLSREEYNRILLERLHGDQRWENQPAAGWSVADLDAVEITRTLEESIRRGRADDPATRDPSEMLRGFGLMKDGQILRAAVVLFGRAERIEAELPQGLLRVAQDVTERQQQVLLCLSGAADGLALRDIRKGLGEGIAEWEIKNDLAALKHLGLVRVSGHARWARWCLA
jgi:ATP-dependent DNA helicase RecG